jgi:hypothetical protein
MFKGSYHPAAYMSSIKNVKAGLLMRTKILNILEIKPCISTFLSKKIGASYRSVLHHLNLLAVESTITRKGKKPYTWQLTGLGQRRLT